MNYDNLHTTAEILEAFQGCRDAGEEIDLFEALAWRKEPPIDAFEVIIYEIKLEPILALAVQSIGWIKSPEILENSRQSKKLLKTLCDLASSGATDLIRWSAAKSIIAVSFDFISISQHLTEMPKDIIKSILSKPESKDTNISCIYGDSCRIRRDTIDIIMRELASFDNSAFSPSILQAKDILSRKGIIRGLQENNKYINSAQENIAFTIAGLQIAQDKLLNRQFKSQLTNSEDSTEFKMSLLNQIYCIKSCSLAVRKSAIKFLCEIDCIQNRKTEFPDLCNLVFKIRDVTKNIQSEIKQFAVNQEEYFDEKDLLTLRSKLTFESTKMSNDLTLELSRMSNGLNSSLIKLDEELTSELTKMSNELNSDLRKITNTISSNHSYRTTQINRVTREKESKSNFISCSINECLQSIFCLTLSGILYIFVDIAVGNFFSTAICVIIYCAAISFSVKILFDLDDDQMGIVSSTAVGIVGISYFFPKVIVHPWVQVVPALVIIIVSILKYRYLSYQKYVNIKDYNHSINWEEQQSEQEKFELETKKKFVVSQVDEKDKKNKLELKKFREDKELDLKKFEDGKKLELERMKNDNSCGLKKIEGYVNDRKKLCI